MTEKGEELVERLKPSWEFDAALSEIVRGEDEELRGVVTRYIVASNQLRTEAATALSERDARIAKLERALEFAEGEIDEAANKLWAISQLAHRMAWSRNTVAATRRNRTTEKKDG